MVSKTWHYDDTTGNDVKQIGTNLLVVSGNNWEIQDASGEAIEYGTAPNQFKARQVAETVFYGGDSEYDLVVSEPETQYPSYQYVGTNPQVEIAKLDFNFRRFLVIAFCSLVTFVTFAGFFGYTLISYQISYGKHGTMLWVLTGSVPISIGIALYYLFTKGFRQ